MKHILIVFITILSLSAYSQPKPPVNKNDKLKLSIAGKYKSITLGMTREEVLDSLKKDVDLEMDVRTDYGEFDEEQKYIVKARRLPFIRQIFYQFYEEKPAKTNGGNNNKSTWKLYAIIIHFNLKHNSYNTLYNRILSKYGEADIRTARFSVWSPKGREKYQGGMPVRLILNKPATIKIIDDKIFRQKQLERYRLSNKSVTSYQRELNDRLLSDFAPDEK
ncbi:MAG: hypothetical protein OEZ36_00430 [Spirochaetota bacterium]|nr:hypothetical protein [Spirochaetota bacterium]